MATSVIGAESYRGGGDYSAPLRVGDGAWRATNRRGSRMDRDNEELGRESTPSGTDAAVMDIWTFRTAEPLGDIDVTGYSVEATDGGIGKVDEATYEVGGSYLVVDTGPWIFGKKVLLPAGLIDRDRSRERNGLRLALEGRDQERAGVRRGARLRGRRVPRPARRLLRPRETRVRGPHGGPAARCADGPRAATIPRRGPLAQLVEQGTLNPKVEGSIPSRPMLIAQDRESAERIRDRAKTPEARRVRRTRALDLPEFGAREVTASARISGSGGL